MASVYRWRQGLAGRYQLGPLSETHRAPGADASEKEPGLIVLGAVLTATFILFAYPGIGIIREIIGQRGLATSPLILAPVIWPLLILFMYFEPRVQQHPRWERIETFWYGAGVTLGLVVPLVVALVWPVPVLTELPRGIPALLSVVAPALVVAAVIVRGRRRRRRRNNDE